MRNRTFFHFATEGYRSSFLNLGNYLTDSLLRSDMNGVLGDRVLVNGVDDAAFKVPPRIHRLRVANVSNARVYKLAWSDGRRAREDRAPNLPGIPAAGARHGLVAVSLISVFSSTK